MSESEGILNTPGKKFKFDTNIVLWTSIIGIFVLILPVPSGSIYGYGLIFFALLGMMLLHLALQTRMNMEAGIMKILKDMIMSSETLPIICVMAILAWLFSLNIKYFDKFNEPNMLPTEFTNFKGLATGLLFVSILLIKSITEDERQEFTALKKSKNPLGQFYKAASESATSILYLVVTILAIVTGLMQVILQYYLTDG